MIRYRREETEQPALPGPPKVPEIPAEPVGHRDYFYGDSDDMDLDIPQQLSPTQKILSTPESGTSVSGGGTPTAPSSPPARRKRSASPYDPEKPIARIIPTTTPPPADKVKETKEQIQVMIQNLSTLPNSGALLQEILELISKNLTSQEQDELMMELNEVITDQKQELHKNIGGEFPTTFESPASPPKFTPETSIKKIPLGGEESPPFPVGATIPWNFPKMSPNSQTRFGGDPRTSGSRAGFIDPDPRTSGSRTGFSDPDPRTSRLKTGFPDPDLRISGTGFADPKFGSGDGNRSFEVRILKSFLNF